MPHSLHSMTWHAPDDEPSFRLDEPSCPAGRPCGWRLAGPASPRSPIALVGEVVRVRDGVRAVGPGHSGEIAVIRCDRSVTFDHANLMSLRLSAPGVQSLQRASSRSDARSADRLCRYPMNNPEMFAIGLRALSRAPARDSVPPHSGRGGHPSAKDAIVYFKPGKSSACLGRPVCHQTRRIIQ